MIVYYVLFGVLLILAIVELCSYKWDNSVRILLTLFMVCLSGFRFEIGDDYTNYVRMFNDPDGFSLIEPGFKLIISLVKLLGLNCQAFFLLTSVLTVVPLAFLINKACPRFFFTALSIYVLSYIYFEGMNTVRQAISMTILFIGFYDYITNRKIVHLVFFTFLALLFHFSAVVVGAVGFIVLRYTGKGIRVSLFAIALVISFVVGIYIQSFGKQINALASLIGYAGYMERFEQRGVQSGAFQYALNLYAILFLFFSHYKGKNISELYKNSIKLLLTAIIIYNVFINFYIGLRFYWYFYLFLIFSIPAILTQFNKNSRAIVYVILMILFILYTILSLNSVHYSPYKCTFNLFT